MSKNISSCQMLNCSGVEAKQPKCQKEYLSQRFYVTDNFCNLVGHQAWTVDNNSFTKTAINHAKELTFDMNPCVTKGIYQFKNDIEHKDLLKQGLEFLLT